MRKTALLTILLIGALTAPPADAACVGCGGFTGTPGSAAIAASGKGLHASHVATADCNYNSTTPRNATGARGRLSLTVRAASGYTSMYVKGVCWIDLPQYYSVEATAQGPNPNVGAGRDASVPPDMVVGRICVRLEAVWSSGIPGDATDVRECTSGATGTVGGIHLDIPISV